MKREFLKGLGIDDKDIIDKIMFENGSDIEKANAKLAVVTGELETANAAVATQEAKIARLEQITEDSVAVKAQLYRLQKEIADKAELDKKAHADKELTNQIMEVFGGKKFVNDYTKNALVAEIKAKFAEDNTIGLDKIVTLITADKEGIFANPNQPASMPAMGNIGNGTITPEQFKKMGMKERTELFNQNKELYEQLKGE